MPDTKVELFWRPALFWQHPTSYGWNLANSVFFCYSKYCDFVPFSPQKYLWSIHSSFSFSLKCWNFPPKKKSLRVRVCQKMNEIISDDSSYAEREIQFWISLEYIQKTSNSFVKELYMHFVSLPDMATQSKQIHTTPRTLIPSIFTNGNPTSSWNSLKKKSESVTTMLSPYKNICVKQLVSVWKYKIWLRNCIGY